ncbi:MAG: type II secretion system protein [bacterium]|nr:type II secretion system protein [bacterium]
MKKTKRSRAGGFTLIEVVVSIALLFMVVAAVFYFYSNLMDNQGRIKEKYALLRIAREFVDSFAFSGGGGLNMDGGRREIEGFMLMWTSEPAEDEREVLFSSGVLPVAQLKRVHLQIFNKMTRQQVLELDFLLNTISRPGER